MEIIKIYGSSALEGYSYENKDLTIYFKDGSAETYVDVPRKIVDEFLEAKSAGLYFNMSIRNKFQRR